MPIAEKGPEIILFLQSNRKTHPKSLPLTGTRYSHPDPLWKQANLGQKQDSPELRDTIEIILGLSEACKWVTKIDIEIVYVYNEIKSIEKCFI